MSYTRVFIFENPKGFAYNFKFFKSGTKPMLDKLKREKSLKCYSVVQTGENSGLMVFDFVNKTKMNKSLKTMAAHRTDVGGDTGMQWWAYHGPVKANG